MDSGWRLKKRLMVKAPPPALKAPRRTAKAKRAIELEDDDDLWMEKATPTIDPTPRPLTSILKFDAQPPIASPATTPSPAHPSAPASDPLTALADAEVASLTPSDSMSGE